MENYKTAKIAREQLAHFERNNYYFGKMLTARDFTDEQLYLNEKRWMLNRLGLGWGVLCGLQVKPHPTEAYKILVEPGFALDAYGHEIRVFKEQMVDLRTVQDNDPSQSSDYYYYVSVLYKECLTNPSPVPIEDCGELDADCEYNRIQENFQFVVERRKPDFTNLLESDLKEILNCETDCHRFLNNPSPVISERCPDRPPCDVVPLACVCYNPDADPPAWEIDMSPENRKLAFSNEMLYELIRCIQQDAWKENSAKYDRRRYIPLLAQTIKGLTYQDGKLKQYPLGTHPFRLTSDGDHIWITDTEDENNQVWRINRKTHQPEGEVEQTGDGIKYLGEPQLRLSKPGWGIAFDGRYMWITHHDSETDNNEEFYGTLTRIDVCSLHQWEITNMKNCDDVPECQTFPDSYIESGGERVGSYPGEIVFHDEYIYVAHSDKINGEIPYQLWFSRIDPRKGCLLDGQLLEVPAENNEKPCSEIIAMASDGDALWFTYRVQAATQRGERAVVRKLYFDRDGNPVFSDPRELRGDNPEKMVFDGTRLWISHNDGVSVVDIRTGEEVELINSRTWHTTMTYGGGDYLYAILPGQKEAHVNRINIFSEDFAQWLELIELDPKTEDGFGISDMQFDGAYLYVAAHIENTEGDTVVKQGKIHRLLP